MANIKITVDGALLDGHKVTFKAPCDCTAVEKLDVYHIKNNTQMHDLFTMKDTHGNELEGIGNLFQAGAYVHCILDTTNKVAYLQNADTNGYIEANLVKLRTDTTVLRTEDKVIFESAKAVFTEGVATINYTIPTPAFSENVVKAECVGVIAQFKDTNTICISGAEVTDQSTITVRSGVKNDGTNYSGTRQINLLKIVRYTFA